MVEEGCSGALSSLGVVLLTSSSLVLKDSCDTLKKTDRQYYSYLLLIKLKLLYYDNHYTSKHIVFFQ